MIKKIIGIFLLSASYSVFAVTPIDLHKASIHRLQKFPFIKNHSLKAFIASEGSNLKQISQTRQAQQIITRYQQMYKGIPVVGAQVTLSTHSNQAINANAEVNGHLLEDIHLNTRPNLSASEALQSATKAYFENTAPVSIHHENTELQIRESKNAQLELVYLVSFKALVNGKPVWPFFVVNAETGEVSQHWNNINNYSDIGAGGNEKVHEYWYGKDGLPGLEVRRTGDICTFEDEQVKLIDLKSTEDWDHLQRTPVQYPCDHNEENPTNGAFSPGNDAYYFGHAIVNMYKDWYGINALQDEYGNFSKLIMRVHFGKYFSNAFWDGETMTFGDSDDYYFYPLVSLDVAGHEVSHGFTQQHSNLEYHDESGALNESFSDMAGQASRAYLLETMPSLYNKAYLTANELTWGIGETITRAPMNALRFMDFPSTDNHSADCLNKPLAQKNGGICRISYLELLTEAQSQYPYDEYKRQSYIVHTASGIFNKAFYLFTKKFGIKSAFHMMVVANTKYWTPNTGFNQGACGVIYAANDLNMDSDNVNMVFNQVGIDVSNCKI
ncbi:MAG: M4 family metallopeptidase [Legionellaceae bacterium]|nr:M4 family metallopeptidase [Legionellaceae bacterium]